MPVAARTHGPTGGSPPARGLAVNPLWPLLALMLGGAWCAWPWFVVNARALSPATWRRQLALVVLALAGAIAGLWIVLWLVSIGLLDRTSARYALLVLPAIKLAVGFRVYLLQAQDLALHEYFGGRVRSGMIVFFLAWLARGRVIQALKEQLDFWVVVLA